jgi:ribosome-associated protein
LLKTIQPALTTLEGRVQRIATLIDEMKGEEIVVLDLRGICDFADAFVIATGRSTTHLQAIANNLEAKLREEGLRPVSPGESRAQNWALLDYADVIVHVFDRQTRRYYDLETLWSDGTASAWPLPQMA